MRVRLRRGDRAAWTKLAPETIRPAATAEHHPADRMAWAAGKRVARAIRDGVLQRLTGLVPCADCGQPATMYDHRDYSRPLDVEPVCRTCNRRRGHAIDSPPRQPLHNLRDAKGRLLPIYPIETIIATAGTGDVVKIPAGDRRPASISVALRMAAKRRGMRVRCRTENGHVVAWAEPTP